MYDSITVNGSVPASLNIEKIDLSYKNQATDTAVLAFNNDVADAPAAFAYGAAVYVSNGDTVIFRGTVKYVEHTGSVSKERVEVTIVNVWDSFDNMTLYFRNTYYYLDGAVQGSDPTPRVSLGGNITTRLQTILSDYVSRSIVAIGQIQLPVITIPETESLNITVADAIKQTLRWTPGALVVFDYQTDPPTLYIGTPELLGPFIPSVIFDVNDGNIESLKYQKRSDLELSGVSIHFEREFERTSINNGIETVSVLHQFLGWQTYPPGVNYYDKNVLFKQLQISESESVKSVTIKITSTTSSHTGYYFYRSNNWPAPYSWPNIGHLFKIYNNFYGSQTQIAIYEESRLTVQSVDKISPVITSALDINNFKYNPGAWYRIEASHVPAAKYLKSADNPSGVEIIKVRVNGVFQDVSNASLYWSGTYDMYFMSVYSFSYSAIVSGSASVSIPSALARQYYELRAGIANYDGSLSVLNTTINPGSFRYIKLLSDGSTVSEGQVQSLNWSSGDDIWRIKFGPPDHLGIQDFMQLLKM